MRVVIQRVKSSRVSVNGEVIAQIGRGLNLLIGIAPTDTEAELEWMARKCLDLRLFPQKGGAWEYSVQEIGGEILAVSQFTLYGDGRKGRRPSFSNAAPPEIAEPLYLRFIEMLRDRGLSVATGKFGAQMEVEIVNDGPVTLLLEREKAL